MNVMDCIECGACTYNCPARLHLVHMFRVLKQKIKDEANRQKAAAAAKAAEEEAKKAAEEAAKKAAEEAAAKAAEEEAEKPAEEEKKEAKNND